MTHDLSGWLNVVHCGDCLDLLKQIPDQSIDAVITDPPYAEVKRDYGRWTESEWWALIVEGVVPEVRRILKPTGSAVFIIQPNSRKVGSMRGWVFEFMAWVCREWNMVQD
ncbi:MAG: DNA methyltransferase, partial [Acidobacteriota bacterium]|nr:DNA methyltransferase [Acidobacteriota bacterium]